MAAISKAQIGTIHALKSRAGLDEESYRDMLERQTGERSSAKLTSAAAGRVIEHLRVLAGDSPGAGAGRPSIDGIWGRKAQALWISGFHLGVFERREDAALMAFVRRQTRVDHINWLRDADQGSAVVEALKAWLRREAGVDWRAHDDPAMCVVLAQWRLLGEPPATGPFDTTTLMQALGARIRRLKTGRTPS